MKKNTKPNSVAKNSVEIPEELTLSRNLSLFTITMIGVGGMIGAGIFVLTGIAAGVAGPALVLVFLLNGIVTLLTGMVYAELGSAFPEAGGGYLWVKEGLGGAQGFLAGWMSWFAHVVAGSLYALGFGRFASEIWIAANLPNFNLTPEQLTLVFMTIIILIFTVINYAGASETGLVGNIVTMTKIMILAFFVLFGIAAMFRIPDLSSRFFSNFMPNGYMSILIAMGLTFIAFEGYEIIAQSGEEVINPQRNVPRAVFLAIGIAVSIYILVSITAIGATTPPAGIETYLYLGEKKEIAVVEVAQQVFPFGVGGAILLISGLVSTMSALNATTYSSSRVSFAMGRDHNLPGLFARIHNRRHTPYLAVIFSGALMLIVAWLLPIEEVAAAADIMFLLLFLQVNAAVIFLRRKMPDLPRGYKIPLFPAIPILGLIANGLLAITLFQFAPVSWLAAGGWIIFGLLLYFAYFSKVEAMEKPREILLEEVLVSRDFSVLVPVASQEQAMILGQIGTIIAHENRGEVLALHVVRVPVQISLGDGRHFLKEGRAFLETIIHQAKPSEVPVHTIIRLGRDVAEAIRKTVEENASDLIVLGWPGYTNSAGRLYGSVIDPIIANPPTDIALVRYRQRRPLKKILVPVSGGPNSQRAVKMAVNMSRYKIVESDQPAIITLLHIVPLQASSSDLVRAKQAFHDAREGLGIIDVEEMTVEGNDVVETVLSTAAGENGKGEFDLIIIGATREPLLKKLFVGSIPDQVARRSSVTVIVVKRRSTLLHSFLRQTVIET